MTTSNGGFIFPRDFVLAVKFGEHKTKIHNREMQYKIKHTKIEMKEKA
jgi:hypothetical protein